MKKLLQSTAIFSGLLFIMSLFMNPVSAMKSSPGGNPIPNDVMKIAEKSCIKCHTEPGNGMALAHLNSIQVAKK